jgi:protein TonB
MFLFGSKRAVADAVSRSMLTNSMLRLALTVCLFLVFVAASPPNRSPVPHAAVLVYGPHPEYPAAARQTGLSGSGWFRIDFTPSGRVTNVRVTRSTGSKILDAAAVQTLWRWRFKPGLKIHCANLPITFRP